MRARRRRRARRHRGHHGRLVKYALTTQSSAAGKEAENGETPEGAAGEEGAEAGASESIGTVASFAEGVLSIKLADGTVVSGKVTGETRLLCLSSEPPMFTGGDDRGAGDDRGSEDRDRGDTAEGEGEEGVEGAYREHGDGSPMARESSFDHPDLGFFAPCETTMLTPETAVREAELRLGREGAVWERAVLVS